MCFVVVLVHCFFCLSACFIKKGKDTVCVGRWKEGLEEEKCNQNILYEKRIQMKGFAKVF